MNQNPFTQITQKLAGHIRQPMGTYEIAKELTNGEYSAELIMQHLLRFVDLMAQRGEIILGDDGSCDWEQNEDGWWNTDCNNAFQFEDGSPIYNEFKFCHYCGKILTETPFLNEEGY